MPTRLLHVVGSSAFGGDSVLILELARAARGHGFDVDVLTTDPPFQECVRDAGLGLVDLDVVRREIRPLWDLHGLARLTMFLAAQRYDVVHTHTSKPGVVGRFAADRTGVPAVLHTVHLFGFHEGTPRPVEAVYAGIERRAARWCDRIVTVSEFHRNWALEKGIGRPDQIVAIPNGVPEGRVATVRGRDAVRAEFDCAPDRPVLLSTGRLAEQKGLEYLIRAVPLLLARHPQVLILLAGTGPLDEELGTLVDRLGLRANVRFLGFRADVGDLLAAADLVVLPSLWEGLSISLLEAMAAGRPVVTTSIGSNVEVTRNGSIADLVRPGDATALATAVSDLLDDPARRSVLGRAGRAEQRARYTIDRMLDAYLAEYDGVLAGSSRRRAHTVRRPVVQP